MSQEPLEVTTTTVRRAGDRMLERYSAAARQRGLTELLADVRANDEAVVDSLRSALAGILPRAGRLNAVHGMTDWNIGVSLVRDGRPASGSTSRTRRRSTVPLPERARPSPARTPRSRAGRACTGSSTTYGPTWPVCCWFRKQAAPSPASTVSRGS
jgi:hypothetical protein